MSVRCVSREDGVEVSGEASCQLIDVYELPKSIRDSLPIKNQEDWLALEAWLGGVDDETCSVFSN